jgi:hypothetical protein
MKNTMLFFLIVIIGIYLSIGYVFSTLLLYSNRQPITKVPVDYGMQFENVTFKSSDGLILKGWFIPGNTRKTIIMTHPMFFNRQGFSTQYQGVVPLFGTNVDLMKTAKALNRAGYSVMMFDFRNHGESGPGVSGVGMTEYQDILGALDFLNNVKRIPNTSIGFVSFCMGADATMATLSKTWKKMKGIRCFVAIQPVSSLVFCRSYIRKQFPIIGLPLIPIISYYYQHRGGFALTEDVPKLFCWDIQLPTMYVQAKEDPWTDISEIKRFYEFTASRQKELWLIEGKMGRFDTYNYVGDNPQKILHFLKTYF